MSSSGKITAFSLLVLVVEVYSQFPIVPHLHLDAPPPPPLGLINIRQPAYIPPQAVRPLASVTLIRTKPIGNLVEETFGNPDPYSFGYDIRDENGNHRYRKEEADGRGVVKGTYGYTDANGIFRFVDYIADDNGFKANIRSNEPGVGDASAADVILSAEEPPRGYLQQASVPRAALLPVAARLSASENQPQYKPNAAAFGNQPQYKLFAVSSRNQPQYKPYSVPSPRAPVYIRPSAAPTKPTFTSTTTSSPAQSRSQRN